MQAVISLKFIHKIFQIQNILGEQYQRTYELDESTEWLRVSTIFIFLKQQPLNHSKNNVSKGREMKKKLLLYYVQTSILVGSKGFPFRGFKSMGRAFDICQTKL